VAEKKPVVEKVTLAKVNRDRATQMRSRIDDATVQRYAEDMTLGHTFPPIVVFRDEEQGEMYLAAGFHRAAAYEVIGRARVDAEIHEGTLRDAIVYAVGENSTHGLPRSDADKRRAVTTLLEDEEWRKWSDKTVAQRANVSRSFVQRVRADIEEREAQQGKEKSTKRKVKRAGKEVEVDTKNIGRNQKRKPSNEPPPTPPPAAPPAGPQDGAEVLALDRGAPAGQGPTPEGAVVNAIFELATRIDPLSAKDFASRVPQPGNMLETTGNLIDWLQDFEEALKGRIDSDQAGDEGAQAAE
jgi:hypothetical protein